MPLPLTVSCSSKIQIGFTFLVPAHPGSPGKRAVKRVSVTHISTYILTATTTTAAAVTAATTTTTTVIRPTVRLVAVVTWRRRLARQRGTDNSQRRQVDAARTSAEFGTVVRRTVVHLVTRTRGYPSQY